jgi:hypothetical protein
MSVRSSIFAVVATLGLATAALSTVAPAAIAANGSPVTGAAFTTTNTSVDGTGHCQNGNEDVNCNIYDGKQYVWMNGGPSTAYVGDGSYFFAVLAPGGQADPNDGSAKNLSDDFDQYGNRTFQVTGGTVSYAGTHDFANNKIRLAQYADTPNPGGVYVLAICSLDRGYPVTASRCKYDAFKVNEAAPARPLTVTKDANGTYDTSASWGIAKNVDSTLMKQVSGNVTFTYSVDVTKSAPVNSNVQVSGTITVFNPNDTTVSDVDVTDQLSDGTVCTVTNGLDQTVATGDTTFPYTCNLSSLPQGDLDNTVVAAWPQQFLDDGSLLADGSATFTFSKIVFTAHASDDCVTAADTFNGTMSSLGQVCDTSTFTYTRSVPVPPFGYTECLSYLNTARFTTNTTQATGSASKTVKVCGPAKTGARPMPYWKTASTGQWVILNSASTGSVCKVGGWLRQYAPFQDLVSNATCTQVAAYTASTAKSAALATAPMTARLKGNELATALAVYFSDPSLGGNKLATKKPVGGTLIDLTLVCHMTDLTTGAGTCGGTNVDARPAFGGSSSLSVAQLLAVAAAQAGTGGTGWYGNDATLQGLAKDAFSAVNNQKAFRS